MLDRGQRINEVCDFVVVGAGHNGLAAAFYLSRLGLKVVVVEAAERVGGSAVTTEPLLAGFLHNPHANSLIFCDIMPRELSPAGLQVDIHWPAAQLGVAFADGRPPVILHRPDMIGHTARSLGVYSKADAQTYRELKRRSATLGPLIARGMYAPPNATWFDEQRVAVRRAFGDVCAASSIGRRSAKDLIDELFRTNEIRVLLYHLAMECGIALDEIGGDIAFLGLAIWMAGRWRLPSGGMQRFSDALGRATAAAGADLRLATPVRHIVVADGRAVGVHTADGTTVTASRGVVAAVPIVQLFTQMIDTNLFSAPERADVGRLDREQSGGIATSVFCLSAPPNYKSARRDPQIDACLKTVIGHESPEDVAADVADVAASMLPRPAGVVRVNSLWDASQAPGGRHVAGVDSRFPSTVSLDDATWSRVEDSFPDAFLDCWSRYADNLDRSSVLAAACDATARFERRMLIRMGSAQYRTSIAGLYMCGPGSFPGGGVHAACGYNAFHVMAQDLGMGG